MDWLRGQRYRNYSLVTNKLKYLFFQQKTQSFIICFNELRLILKIFEINKRSDWGCFFKIYENLYLYLHVNVYFSKYLFVCMIKWTLELKCLFMFISDCLYIVNWIETWRFCKRDKNGWTRVVVRVIVVADRCPPPRRPQVLLAGCLGPEGLRGSVVVSPPKKVFAKRRGGGGGGGKLRTWVLTCDRQPSLDSALTATRESRSSVVLIRSDVHDDEHHGSHESSRFNPSGQVRAEASHRF